MAGGAQRQTNRPALRPVETIVVPDAEHGRLLVLRDTQGIAGACVHPAGAHPHRGPVHGRADLRRDRARGVGGGRPADPDGARRADREGARGRALPRRAVVPRRARGRPAAVSRRDAPTREPRGGRLRGRRASSPPTWTRSASRRPSRGPRRTRLRRARGGRSPGSSPPTSTRGAAPSATAMPMRRCGTGWRTRRTRSSCSGRRTRRSSSPSRSAGRRSTPRSGRCRPTSRPRPHRGALPVDPYVDELNHKREHSIEFQAVFLKHVLRGRAARIIPILAGLAASRRAGPTRGRTRTPWPSSTPSASWWRSAGDGWS